MDKVIEDGCVAVLYSPGYGAGWSTWVGAKYQEAALFHPKFVQAARDGVLDVDPVVEEIFGSDTTFYTGGWEDITIKWVPVGTRFRIREYDGYETVEYLDRIEHYVA